MANLISKDRPYLHSQKWTFFNYCEKNVSALRGNKDITSKYLTPLISKLQSLRAKALQQEAQFYTDFEVKDNFEWAQKYLSSTNENASLAQKIQAIINSKEMIEILSGQKRLLTSAQQQNFINQAIASAEKSVGVMAQSPAFLDAITVAAENITGQALLGIANSLNGSENETNFQSFERQFLKDVLKEKRRYYPNLREDYQNTQAKKLQAAFLQNSSTKSRSARREQAINFLETSLLRDGVDSTTISQISTNWRAALEANDEDALRLTSDGETNIIGVVSEKSLTIAFMNTTLPNSEYNDSGVIVKQFSSKVRRFGRENKVSSKTDTIWTSKNGHSYNIQNKNSLTDLDKIDQIVDLKNDIYGRPLELKLSDEISLSTLESQLSAANIISEDNLALISYLLVNLNVLSKESFTRERIFKGKGRDSSVKSAAKTQQLVSQILTGAIQLFCADFNDNSGQLEFSNAYDFIIYKNKYLIPMSDMYLSLIQSLQDYFNSIARIWITSSLSGYSKAEFQAMYWGSNGDPNTGKASSDGKKYIIDQERGLGTVSYDYHNQELVERGQLEGAKVRNLIKVNAIRLKIFDPKNYLSQGYDAVMRKQGLLPI